MACIAAHPGAYLRGYINGFIAVKLDLTADAEYVANLVICQYVVVNVQQCSLLHGYAVPA